MKKLILMLVILFSVTLGYSQARIRFTYSEIAQELKDRKMDFIAKDTITVFTSEYKILYLFKGQICIKVIIIPLTEGSYLSMVELYNKKYEYINHYTWHSIDPPLLIQCSANVLIKSRIKKQFEITQRFPP